MSERTRAGEPEALFSGAGMAGDSFVLTTASSTSHNAKRLTPLQVCSVVLSPLHVCVLTYLVFMTTL